MNDDFKKGDLVIPESFQVLREKPPVGLILQIGKQPDGKTHHILWVDSEGCFESWHYENQFIHYNYKKLEVEDEEEA